LSGGLPGILRGWPSGTPALTFAEDACSDPASPLFGVPETTLLAEFPEPDVASRVLTAIDGSERTFAKIAAIAGTVSGASATGARSAPTRPCDALVGVSLTGFSRGVAEQLALAWTARDVVAAFGS
jgi:hypothetical protein